MDKTFFFQRTNQASCRKASREDGGGPPSRLLGGAEPAGVEGVRCPRGIIFRRFKPPGGEVGAGDVTVINAQFLQEETQDGRARVPLWQVLELRDSVHLTFPGHGGGPIPNRAGKVVIGANHPLSCIPHLPFSLFQLKSI